MKGKLLVICSSYTPFLRLGFCNYFFQRIIYYNFSSYPLSYRNQSIDFRSKSMDWFLYDNGPRHERVNLNADAGIIHYEHALFRNRNNGLQSAYFVDNGLQSASMNRRFLNIIHKINYTTLIFGRFRE